MTKPSTFATLAFLALTALVTPAVAQDAPPESQLTAPVGDMPQPAAVPSMPMPEQTAPAAQQNAPVPSGSATFDPCPAPKDAIASSPDDLAKVQEEIDRFTLCVQRAQLLERLNETALKSEMATDAALGLGGGSIDAVPDASESGLAPLPASALAGADVSPTSGSTGADVPETEKAEEPSATPVIEAPKDTPWTIREVFGSGAAMKAKLLSPDGDEVRLGEGASLPDGKGTIVRITPSGVTVRMGGSTKDLDWARK